MLTVNGGMKVKKAVKGKKEAWLNVLKANDEVSKERGLELYKEEKRNTKRCIRRRKQEVNEQFGRRMNRDLQGNRKLFWKEARKVKNENKGNLLLSLIHISEPTRLLSI